MKTNNIIAALVMNSAIALALTTGLNAATKTIKFGDSLMGATLTGDMGYYLAPQSGGCDFYARGSATGSVFFNSINLASGSGSFRINQGSTSGRGWGYLNVGSSTLVRWDRTFTGTTDFSTGPLTVRKTVSYDVLGLGVIKIGTGVSATVRSEGKFSVVGSLGSRIGGKGPLVTPTVVVNCGPSIDVAVSGHGYANIGVASGAVNGQLTLCKMALNASATMTPAAFNTSNVNYAMTLRTETLSGRVWGYVDSPIMFKKPFDKSWTGFTSTSTLASGSFTLRGAPIVQLN